MFNCVMLGKWSFSFLNFIKLHKNNNKTAAEDFIKINYVDTYSKLGW